MEARKQAIGKFESDSEELLAGFAPILKEIESISMLTTILALNATIEAANAGEAGAGFGVVAKHVGELAKKTSEETVIMQKYVNQLKRMMTSAVSEFKKDETE
jgi:methyl-accepting chemotaxis protein